MEKRFAWLEFFMFLVLSLGGGYLIALSALSDLSRWTPLFIGFFTSLVIGFGVMRCPNDLSMLNTPPGSTKHTALSLIGMFSGLLHIFCCFVIIRSYSNFFLETSVIDNFVVLLSNNYAVPLYAIYFIGAAIIAFFCLKLWYQFETPENRVVYIGEKKMQPKEIFVPLPFYRYLIKVE